MLVLVFTSAAWSAHLQDDSLRAAINLDREATRKIEATVTKTAADVAEIMVTVKKLRGGRIPRRLNLLALTRYY